MDIGTYLTLTHKGQLIAGQVVRLKKTASDPEDWKLEVRGRSGRTLIVESYIDSGAMLWPNWEHCDAFTEGGWKLLAERGMVRTYYFDVKVAREKEQFARDARKPAMVREDQDQEVEFLPKHVEKLREWIKKFDLDEYPRRVSDEGELL